jgi:hypothetical protein
MNLITRGALCAIAIASLLSVQNLSAKELELQSGPSRATLLELYTSEGCSSCPPADRWLSGLVDDARLWKEVVPIAFHVDYWDYIGWKDRFADEAFGARQQAYARHGGVRSVYTPGFVLGGEEWRSWFSKPVLQVPNAPDPGILKVQQSGKDLRVAFEPTAVGRGQDPVVHVALLGFDLSTTVKTGENHGRKLHHDFVVIGYQRLPMQVKETSLTAALKLPSARVDAPRTALVIWVSHQDDPRPVQAVGGWM